MSKEIPFGKITIRCISTASDNQKVKFVYPNIANNKQLLKNVGFVISDPNYDAKMEAFRMKKPYSENGKASEPAKEAFIAPVEEKPEPKIEQPKNEIQAPVIKDEPVKRVRRTKAQIEADKLSKTKVNA